MTAMEKHEASGNNPLKDLNLVALRKFACPSANKTNEWYLKCVDCNERTTCLAGRRVNEIMENMTKPEKSQIQKFEERAAKKEKLTAEDRFQEAMKHEDPFKWLVENGHYKNRDSAQSTMTAWAKKNGVDISRFKKKNGSWMVDKIRSRLVNAFDGAPESNKMEWVLKKLYPDDVMITSASMWLYTSARKYPDLSEKYGVSDIAKEFYHYTNLHKELKKVSEVLKMLEKERAPESDEVSLEDFLKENSVEEPAQHGMSGDPADDKKHAIKMIDAVKEQQEIYKSDQQFLRVMFGKKRQDLKARIEREKKNLADIQAEIERLRGQIKTLDEAAALFGMAPTINCGKEATA